MAQIKISLDWRRDTKGYRMVAAKPPVGKARTLLDDVGITRPDALVAAAMNQGKLLRVIPLGGADTIEFYRPLDQFESLFRIFANTARRPDGVLDFIEKFGPLTGDGLNPRRGEPVSDVIKHASSMHELLALHATGDGKRLASQIGTLGVELTKIGVSLVGDRITESLKLLLSVETLIEGLWLQFGQALSSGATIERCLRCSDLFETGPGSGRRLGAKFCSDDHRIAFNSQKRSPAR